MRGRPTVKQFLAGRLWSSRTLFAVSGRICKTADLAILSGAAVVLLLLPHMGVSA